MLQISHTCSKHSFNQTHVLVASTNISLSCLEGRIYIITLLNLSPVLIILLNPLPVLVALKILRDILSFMINTPRLLVVSKAPTEKENNSVLYRGLLHVCLFTVRRYNVLSECVWFSVTPDLYRENCHATDIALTERLGSNGFYIIFYSYKANQTRFECSLLF